MSNVFIVFAIAWFKCYCFIYYAQGFTCEQGPLEEQYCYTERATLV